LPVIAGEPSDCGFDHCGCNSNRPFSSNAADQHSSYMQDMTSTTATTQVDELHTFHAPSATDSRGPCPGLNTLANHGYIPRDGTHIGCVELIHALHKVYGLSIPLGTMLTAVAMMECGHISPSSGLSFDLASLLHAGIDHDASLVVDNPNAQGQMSAAVDPVLLQDLVSKSSDGKGLTLEDIARVRVNREAGLEKPLDSLHAFIAQGEAGLLLGLFGKDEEVPIQWAKQFLGEHKLPEDWKKPTHLEGFVKAIKDAKAVQDAMEDIKKLPPPAAAAVTEWPDVVPTRGWGGGFFQRIRDMWCMF